MPEDHARSHAHADSHGSELSEMQLRVRALETILTEKGYVDPAALDQIVEAFETRIGPRNGAQHRRPRLDRPRLQAPPAGGCDRGGQLGRPCRAPSAAT